MNDKLSLKELQLIIKDSLYLALPGMYWVVAEISEIKENYAGHCYLELLEKDPDEVNIRARARGVIWAKRYSFLKPLFESVTGESLREGFKVLLKVTVEYHEIYGLSLVISDLDPSFTIGEMAVKRKQIIRKLEEDGVFSMNKELDFPLLPKRIAVISSRNAAGYTDFFEHLSVNPYNYKFYTALFDANMQGTETGRSVVNALIRISENIELFDVVVIIRGGGSQTDLSWFDNYDIAYHITQFPIPVLTGIGHEKDMTVTDLVAWKSLKTPTAVADYFLDSVAETENNLTEMYKTISELALKGIAKSREILDRCRMKLIPAATSNISEEKKKLSAAAISIINLGKSYLSLEAMIPAQLRSGVASAVKHFLTEKENLLKKSSYDLKTNSGNQIRFSYSGIDMLRSKMLLLSPENVLKRGYTMTSLNGRIIKSAPDLKEGDMIETQFIDGKVKSKVSGKK